MTISIPKEVEDSIHEAVQSGRFSSADEAITSAWLAFDQSQTQALIPERGPSGEDVSRRANPVWERILERSAAIPDEEWDRLPTDLSEQHDHYLYGTPKRPTR